MPGPPRPGTDRFREWELGSTSSDAHPRCSEDWGLPQGRACHILDKTSEIPAPPHELSLSLCPHRISDLIKASLFAKGEMETHRGSAGLRRQTPNSILPQHLASGLDHLDA